MRIYSLGQISAEEKSNILEKHRTLYDGYRTIQPNVSNTQSLYTMDFAGDKNGITVSNKGDVKKYTNVGINEEVSEKEMCSECGGGMYEGECMECGWKGESVLEYEDMEEDIYHTKDLNPKEGFDYVEPKGSNKIDTFKLTKENADNYDYIKSAYNQQFKGPGRVYPVAEEDDVVEYETMESAWSEDLDEVDVSGSQGIYTSMKNPYIHPFEGPGKAGPYQRFSYYEEELDEDWSEDEENWEEIDEDLQESFLNQKNKIHEMMNRMKILK